MSSLSSLRIPLLTLVVGAVALGAATRSDAAPGRDSRLWYRVSVDFEGTQDYTIRHPVGFVEKTHRTTTYFARSNTAVILERTPGTRRDFSFDANISAVGDEWDHSGSSNRRTKRSGDEEWCYYTLTERRNPGAGPDTAIIAGGVSKFRGRTSPVRVEVDVYATEAPVLVTASSCGLKPNRLEVNLLVLGNDARAQGRVRLRSGGFGQESILFAGTLTYRERSGIVSNTYKYRYVVLFTLCPDQDLSRDCPVE